jgi:hypothetical protein
MTGQVTPRDTDAYEEAVDQAISACGGDMRATVKALLIANSYLEAELDSVIESVSNGYARGRVRLREGGWNPL